MMKRKIIGFLFAGMFLFANMVMPVSAQSWESFSSVSGDSNFKVEYRITWKDSSKKECTKVDLNITNKYSKTVMKAKVEVRFKGGKDYTYNITALEAGRQQQFTYQGNYCGVEKVYISGVQVSPR